MIENIPELPVNPPVRRCLYCGNWVDYCFSCSVCGWPFRCEICNKEYDYPDEAEDCCPEWGFGTCVQ